MSFSRPARSSESWCWCHEPDLEVPGLSHSSVATDHDREGARSLRSAQHRVDEWISQFEEGYWPPLANLARLMEEVGELARLVNHRFGTKPKKPGESEQELAEELADVLFVILCMANEQGIDLEDAFEQVLGKYRARDGDRWERKRDAG